MWLKNCAPSTEPGIGIILCVHTYIILYARCSLLIAHLFVPLSGRSRIIFIHSLVNLLWDTFCLFCEYKFIIIQSHIYISIWMDYLNIETVWFAYTYMYYIILLLSMLKRIPFNVATRSKNTAKSFFAFILPIPIDVYIIPNWLKPSLFFFGHRRYKMSLRFMVNKSAANRIGGSWWCLGNNSNNNNFSIFFIIEPKTKSHFTHTHRFRHSGQRWYTKYKVPSPFWCQCYSSHVPIPSYLLFVYFPNGFPHSVTVFLCLLVLELVLLFLVCAICTGLPNRIQYESNPIVWSPFLFSSFLCIRP